MSELSHGLEEFHPTEEDAKAISEFANKLSPSAACALTLDLLLKMVEKHFGPQILSTPQHPVSLLILPFATEDVDGVVAYITKTWNEMGRKKI